MKHYLYKEGRFIGKERERKKQEKEGKGRKKRKDEGEGGRGRRKREEKCVSGGGGVQEAPGAASTPAAWAVAGAAGPGSQRSEFWSRGPGEA